jgi:hypothetical protein
MSKNNNKVVIPNEILSRCRVNVPNLPEVIKWLEGEGSWRAKVFLLGCLEPNKQYETKENFKENEAQWKEDPFVVGHLKKFLGDDIWVKNLEFPTGTSVFYKTLDPYFKDWNSKPNNPLERSFFCTMKALQSRKQEEKANLFQEAIEHDPDNIDAILYWVILMTHRCEDVTPLLEILESVWKNLRIFCPCALAVQAEVIANRLKSPEDRKTQRDTWNARLQEYIVQ